MSPLQTTGGRLIPGGFSCAFRRTSLARHSENGPVLARLRPER